MTELALSEDDVLTVTKTARALFDYSAERDLAGACHEVCALGYILLREQGISAELLIGVAHTSRTPFAQMDGAPVAGIDFDHSWLEVDGLPIDVAIARPNPPAVPLAPVLFGHHLDDSRPAEVTYGVEGALDEQASEVARSSLADYMDRFPGPGSLWRNLVAVGRTLGLELDVDATRARYGSVKWSRRPSDVGLADARPQPRPSSSTGAKIGRNEPCPCGSGKKYKKCCSL